MQRSVTIQLKHGPPEDVNRGRPPPVPEVASRAGARHAPPPAFDAAALGFGPVPRAAPREAAEVSPKTAVDAFFVNDKTFQTLFAFFRTFSP